MDESKWYLRTQDETFGPEPQSRLVEWARMGRIMPGQEVSDDNMIWRRVEEVPFLDMRYSIDIGDGNPRGPFNRAAAEALLASGRLPKTATILETREPFEQPEEERPEEEPEAPVAAEVPAAPAAQAVAEPEVRVVEKLVEVPVEKIVEVPVEKIVEKIVEVPVERVVEKEVRVEVPVEKIVEVPVDRIVEKIVEKEVEKLVEVPVEKIVEVEKLIEVPVEKIVEKEVEKIVVDDRRVKELEALLADSQARVSKLSEQVVALENEIKRIPQAASEVADTQAAVFKIMQDESSELLAEIEREKNDFDAIKRRHSERLDKLLERRREIQRRSGTNLEEMTRKALIERPEDPRMVRLRREYEDLRRLYERAMHENELKVRDLSERLRLRETEAARQAASTKDLTQVRAEAEQLREQLKRAQKDLLNERQQCEIMRQREAANQQTLMNRLASLESPSIGTTQSLETNQSREAKLVKLPSWMRLKR